MGVSENSGTPKSSVLIGFSIINHPFWGIPIFGNTHMISLLRILSAGFRGSNNRFQGISGPGLSLVGGFNPIEKY